MSETVIEIGTSTTEVNILESPTVIEVGVPGIPGPQGIPGIDGTDGVDGVDGTDGIDGADGAPGPNIINSSTTTTFSGILVGDGSFVSSALVGSGLTLASGVLFATPVTVITAHSSLTGLDYASAGHTGFQAALSFPLSPTLGGTGVANLSGATLTVTGASSISGSNTGDQDLSGLLVKANNLSDLTNAETARTNLGLVSGGAGDIWVNTAGDTMTRQLFIDGTSDEIQLRVQNHSTQNANIQTWEDSSGNLTAFVTKDGYIGIGATSTPSNSKFIHVTGSAGATKIKMTDTLTDGKAGVTFQNDAHTWDIIIDGATSDALTFVHTSSPNNTPFRIQGTTAMGLVDVQIGSLLRVTPSPSIASAAGATWDSILFNTGTATITGGTNITTATGFNLFTINRPTLSAGTALTVTNAASLYIQNSPLGGGAGPATITNAYSIWVDDGNVRFDGTLGVGAGPATNKGLNLRLTNGTTGLNGIDNRVTLSADVVGGAGIHSRITPNANQTSTGETAPMAVFAYVELASSRTIAEITGVGSYINMDNSPTITVWKGVNVFTPVQGGSPGTITTAYAIHVEDQTIGATNYALFTKIGRASLLGSTTIASSAGATWNGVELRAATATITGSTNITTATGFNYHTIARPTLSAGTALTVTNSASLYIANSPVGAGAGPAAITNAYSLWIDAGVSRFDGNLDFAADGTNFIFGTTTGVKIGTATTQKLSFWNATPIVQPTTASASATFVANSGTAVNDASTFDGYTLKQVVKALRDSGLLA